MAKKQKKEIQTKPRLTAEQRSLLIRRALFAVVAIMIILSFILSAVVLY